MAVGAFKVASRVSRELAFFFQRGMSIELPLSIQGSIRVVPCD
jgi:hypothetical protein